MTNKEVFEIMTTHKIGNVQKQFDGQARYGAVVCLVGALLDQVQQHEHILHDRVVETVVPWLVIFNGTAVHLINERKVFAL